MGNRVLRLPEVIARTGLQRSSIYRLIKRGAFPPNIALGIRGVGWLESEITAWMEERIKESRT